LNKKVPWAALNLNPRFGNNFIDANVLDPGRADYDEAIDRILALVDAGKFTLLLPYSVKREIEHPHTPIDVKKRAARLNFSIRVELTAPELATHARIRELIRGNAQSDRHVSDSFHLVEAAKYGGRHFITNDGRLLKKAPDIWGALQIRVISPVEFVAEYFPSTPPATTGPAAKADRALVTQEALNKYITQEIRKIEDLEDARLTVQYLLQEPDEDGCNWSGGILNPGSKGSARYGAPHATLVIERARALYNVKQ
jgi:hypothetical protein